MNECQATLIEMCLNYYETQKNCKQENNQVQFIDNLKNFEKILIDYIDNNKKFLIKK